MAEKIESLKDIKSASVKAAASASSSEAVVRKAKKDKFGRSYAPGKRKDAVARVWVKPGKGNITVNTKTLDEYFARPVFINRILTISFKSKPSPLFG